MVEIKDDFKNFFMDFNEERLVSELFFYKLNKKPTYYEFNRKIIERLDKMISDKFASEVFNDKEFTNNTSGNNNPNLKKAKSSKKKRGSNNSNIQMSQVTEKKVSENECQRQEAEYKTSQQVEKFFQEYSNFSTCENSNQKDPNMKFLLTLSETEKKNKKLEQLIITKNTSIKDKSKEDINSQNDLLTIIHTESVEQQLENNKIDQKGNSGNEIMTIDEEERTKEASSNKSMVKEKSNEGEETTKKKKKHRDGKKKGKNTSNDILKKLDKFQRTISDNYKFPMPSAKGQNKKLTADDKKVEVTKEQPKIIEEEPQIKLNKLDKQHQAQSPVQINTKAQNLTIAKPQNEPNTVVTEGVKSPYTQGASNYIYNQKTNSPYVNRTLNTEKTSSPFTSRQINSGDKIRSPYTNKFSDVASKVTLSPSTRNENFSHLSASQQSFYQNSNFYPPENKNKYSNKYSSVHQSIGEGGEGMNISNPVRPQMNNGYMMMNPQYLQMMTNNFRFNYPLGNTQFPIGNQTADIPYNFNFKKIEMKERNFYHKLHNDILEYSTNINNVNESLKEIKQNLIKFVEEKLEEFLVKYNLKIVLNVYGSFRTELSIETSDIDLSINFINAYNFTKENITNLISDLSTQFENLKLFDKVVALTGASVPIIKLEIDPFKVLEERSMELYMKFNSLRNSELFNEYKFDKEEINIVKIDLNFTENVSTSLAVNWARSMVHHYPEIKPIIQVLKRYILNNKLNDAYKGGLSSYSLLITIVFYLRTTKKRDNLGEMLFEYFKLFGEEFDFTKYGIDLNSPNPKISLPLMYDFSLIIKDPVNPLNNVAKSSFKFEAIKQFFSNAYIVLKQYSTAYTSEGKDIDNIIYDFLLDKKYNY